MMLFDGRPPHDNGEAMRAAQAHAGSGGQALHVWDPDQYGWRDRDVPAVFRRSRFWAHLFDDDLVRLRATARRLGVQVIAVGRERRPGQHIDLCGGPLARALKECESI